MHGHIIGSVFSSLFFFFFFLSLFFLLLRGRGWSGGAMVLGKLSVPGRPINLNYSRARAYCVTVGAGEGCLDIFSLVYHFSSFSLSLGDGPI